MEMVEETSVNVSLPEESALEEKDLLGEATLAKLSDSRQASDTVEVVADAVEPAVEAVVTKAVETAVEVVEVVEDAVEPAADAVEPADEK